MNWEFHAAAAELLSTHRRVHLVLDAPSLMLEQVQSHGPQLCEVEVAVIAAHAARKPAESTTQSSTASGLALRGKFGWLAGL